MNAKLSTDALLNDFAIRSFRDQGDADYISARMAYRAAISTCLWSSQQMVEKYLKCILLLHRIKAPNISHDLRKGLGKIRESPSLELVLSPKTSEFIDYIDGFGRYRYLEISTYFDTLDIVNLDRTAWELRRFCTLDPAPGQIALIRDVIPTKIELPGGYLESIITDLKNPAREALIWKNAFFGKRQRRYLKGLTRQIRATNSPLDMHPEILEEIVEYVKLPDNLARQYRSYALTK